MRRRSGEGRATGLVMLFRTTAGEVTVPVVVHSDGEFWAEWEGDSYRSTTFEGLRKKLMQHVRTDLKRVAVPVLRLDFSGEWEEMTLVGLHAQNGNVLAINAKGETQQFRSTSRAEFFPMLTPAQRDRFTRLHKAVKAAERELRTWKTMMSTSPRELVFKALGLPPPKPRPNDDEDDDEGDE